MLIIALNQSLNEPLTQRTSVSIPFDIIDDKKQKALSVSLGTTSKILNLIFHPSERAIRLQSTGPTFSDI